MPLQRWWEGSLEERFWIEVTDRVDLGLDLHAPAADEEGYEYWSYALVREVREGDIVLHYRARPHGSITHWSRAVGEPYQDEVVWGAHGQASGRGPVDPYPRPGWRRPLDGPYPLPAPVSKEQLRELEPAIRRVRDALLATHGTTPLYFPFQLSDTRPLRAFQGYVAKFPRALVNEIPQLAFVAELASATAPTPVDPSPAAADPGLGTPYRPANPEVRTAKREPFAVDPDLVDRALQAHASTQEAVADAALGAGFDPRSAAPGEPEFDLAWEDGEAIVVVEVKSLTEKNEEKQLRLAVGQVLRYGHLLGAKDRPVHHVIATEREPSDSSWQELCAGLGIKLVWLPELAGLFAA
jgi:hypothetical protein